MKKKYPNSLKQSHQRLQDEIDFGENATLVAGPRLTIVQLTRPGKFALTAFNACRLGTPKWREVIHLSPTEGVCRYSGHISRRFFCLLYPPIHVHRTLGRVEHFSFRMAVACEAPHSDFSPLQGHFELFERLLASIVGLFCSK